MTASASSSSFAENHSSPAPATGAGGGSSALSEKQGGSSSASTNGPKASVSAAALWRAQLLSHIERRRKYPDTARLMKREGLAQVSFTLSRSGRVIAVSLLSSAGFRPLDAEAVDVITRSQPFPPPPPEVTGEEIRINLPVNFELSNLMRR